MLLYWASLKCFKVKQSFWVNLQVVTLSEWTQQFTELSDIKDLTVWLDKANKQALIKPSESVCLHDSHLVVRQPQKVLSSWFIQMP